MSLSQALNTSVAGMKVAQIRAVADHSNVGECENPGLCPQDPVSTCSGHRRGERQRQG